MQVPTGSGIEVVQSFDPIPLFEVMEGLGYEHFTEQKGPAEFHAYFYRREVCRRYFSLLFACSGRV